jgi:predicted ester cyclase
MGTPGVEVLMSVDQNKAVVQALIDAWNVQDRSAFTRLVDAPLQQEALLHFDELVAAFSDVHVAIADMIAEGDRVAARLTVSGRHDSGRFAGVEPSGRSLTWGSFRFYRLLQGRVVESWAMQDRLSLFQQLGLVPSLESLVHWAADETEEEP